MERRTLGSLEVSVCGLGCNNFGGRVDAAGTDAVVRAALDAGVTFFDTADIYGGSRSEEYLGRALGSRRDEAVIATKFGHVLHGADDWQGGGSRSWIERAVEGSLRRLGTDRIDLYQIHLPDPQTPIEETLDALDRLVRAGKVRDIGHSNFSGAEVEEAARAAERLGVARFVSAQNHYNLLHRDEVERDVGPACARNRVALIPYFPLASGLLTGKYRRGEEPPAGSRLASAPPERRATALADERLAVVEELEGIARGAGVSLLTLAMSWLASRAGVVSVIAGATVPEQVKANAAAAGWMPPEDVLNAVDGATAARAV